ncbi:nitric oxide synthase-interacting protein homolog [Neodiprion virginianus]|uniref:Nitric oxide synthase-interacting protein homolog n=1 Tax=Neodiprion lecontei TaxID=441921 RepID=A0A6J0C6Y2_NEOLC|nr:nitric oxide synthase-interacting protein homolog [Neodiprion lecontei]XP_046628350.1 nitric oxide synthase-interacting protein homolog [Neodiprion virginianus]
MTRHARNCTAGAVYTYHEKKKDAAASGYGTNSQRVSKDSLKDFDCCCLTLQPCRYPVVTKDGYLFDKEAILEYILTKKKQYARKLKEYEKQREKDEEQSKEQSANEELQKLQNFLKAEKNIVSQNKLPADEPGSSSISNMSNGRDKTLPSFWIPAKTPQAKEVTLQKPDKNIYCPVSGQVLKLKDLIPVKFTEVNDPDDKKSLILKQARYMCPITHDVLSNSVPCAVIKTTGHVVTMECVEKIIKKDWIHPLDGSTIKESDIIVLQRGGTGYAAANDSLEGKHQRPVLQA